MKVSRLCMANLAAVLANRDILAHFLSCLFEVDIDQDLLKIDIAQNYDIDHWRPDIVVCTPTRAIGVSVGTWHTAEHITTDAAEIASSLSIEYHMARNYVVIISPEIPASWNQDKVTHYIPPYPGNAGNIDSPGNHIYIVRPGGCLSSSLDLQHLSIMLSGRIPCSPAQLIEHIWAEDIAIPWDSGIRLLAKNTYREALHGAADPDEAAQAAIAAEARKRADAILTYSSVYGLGLSDYELANALGLSLDDARSAMAGEGLDLSNYIKEETHEANP